MVVKKPASSSRNRPDIFAWSGKYRVGIARVDQQHKKLVMLINALARQLTEQAAPGALTKVLDELASYTNYHFKAEENLMRQHRVDADFQEAHRQAHASFIQEITRAADLIRKNPEQISTRTLTFLSRWLIQHILGTDMRMANEIIALEKGLTAEEARKRANSKVADSQEVLLGAMGELYESLAVRTQELLQANQQLKDELAFHQRAEDQLRTLSMAVEYSPVSTFITDAQGVFEYVNRRFVEITGYTADEVVGQTPRLLKSGEMSEETYEVLWKSIAAGNPWIGELRNRHKSGELYWERVSVTPIIDADGRVTHFLALQEDVTGQRLAKEDLSHSHAQLLASLAQQTGDLARLNQAGDLLQRCLTEAEAHRALAYAAELLVLGKGGALALMDAAKRGLATVVRWGEAPPISGSFPADACWAIRRGAPHSVADIARGLVCGHFAGPPTPYLCLPLLLRGQLLGLLHIVLADQTDEVQLTRLTQVGTALGSAFVLALEHLRRAAG